MLNSIRNIITLARKELSIYFSTPWAYLVFTAMIFITAFFFLSSLSSFLQIQEEARAVKWDRMPAEYQIYKNLTDGIIVPLWGAVLVLTLFVAPFLSMRLFAEEKRNKTFELLMTTPLRSIDIVLGKYLGGLIIIGTTLGLTIAFPLILALYGGSESGHALEWSTVGIGYLALLLWGGTCMAIGMFISALTESQMLAAFLTFAVLLPWMLLGSLAQSTEGALRSVLKYVAFDAQLQNMLRGVVDLKALVFFASIILLAILFTQRAVEAQRWT